MSPPKGGWWEKIITSQRTPEGCLVNTQTFTNILQVESEIFTQNPVVLVGTGGSVLNEPPQGGVAGKNYYLPKNPWGVPSKHPNFNKNIPSGFRDIHSKTCSPSRHRGVGTKWAPSSQGGVVGKNEYLPNNPPGMYEGPYDTKILVLLI